MSTSVYTGLTAFNFIRKHFLQICVRKPLCTYKRCWKCCPRASIQVWTRLILFINPFCRSAFGESLYTYKRYWKWCSRASIQAWTRLILFVNNFCRSTFGKSLWTYKTCWKWCPRASIEARTNSTYRSLSEQWLSERTVFRCKTELIIFRTSIIYSWYIVSSW
jgi:Pyruvate/2-oxoacid:ferredoxin oxidoreductase delta subunit